MGGEAKREAPSGSAVDGGLRALTDWWGEGKGGVWGKFHTKLLFPHLSSTLKATWTNASSLGYLLGGGQREVLSQFHPCRGWTKAQSSWPVWTE